MTSKLNKVSVRPNASTSAQLSLWAARPAPASMYHGRGGGIGHTSHEVHEDTKVLSHLSFSSEVT